MEWFGLTMCGYQNYLKSTMRPDYKEPEKILSVNEQLKLGTKKPLSDLLKELDVYIGHYDGYAYDSLDRIKRQKQKGIRKPVDPNKMFRYAATEAQNYGFWIDDPALNLNDWHKKSLYKPKPVTEVGRFLDTVQKIDKFFKL
ncbi:hypothetical protein RN001_000443 [Aquatica leii]|uniref:Uncharacterized protein n=1 Tax=Aquatica leii TaxID=1421715 RepID=A0AAN7PEW4_9COLE|nr:hypothetical protein RN001_000443 [Aquatica leii]